MPPTGLHTRSSAPPAIDALSDVSVLDALATIVVVAAPDGRIVRVNSAFTDVTGYDDCDVLGRSFVDVLLHPDEAASVTRALTAVHATRFPLQRERRWLDRHGNERLIALTIDAIRDADGRLEYLVSNGVDVTDRRAAEAQAAQWRARLETFVDHAPAVIYLKTLDGRYQVVNREFERFAGVSRDRILGQRPADVFDSAFADDLDQTDREIMATGRPAHRQHTLGSGDDQTHHETVKFPLHAPDGSIDGIGGISAEVTTRVHAEQQLEASYRETIQRLARAVELRDNDTGDHVERMSSYCELIASRLGMGDERSSLIRAASTMHDAGKIAIPDSILLSPARLDARQRAVMETHAAIGHDLLAGSRSPVLQLAASIAHTHHERYDGSGYPRGLAGKGIPLEGRIAAVADVFDALTSERPYRAALSVDAALELMQGERGSQFDPVVLDTFMGAIDAVRALAKAAAPARTTRRRAADHLLGGRAPTGPASGEAALAGRRIVVIDGDPATRALLRGGYGPAAQVVEATSGEDGVKAVYSTRPDLVVLEVGAPDVDGWDVLTRIRDLSDVPVMMLSASGAELEKARALRAGADDHVTKPFGIGEVVARSEALLRRPRASADELARYADPVVTIDFESAMATAGGRPLDLTPLEFRVLTALVRHPDQVLSASQLLNLAWGDERLPTDRVTVYMGYLRTKFRDAGVEPPIETVRGFGYRYQPLG